MFFGNFGVSGYEPADFTFCDQLAMNVLSHRDHGDIRRALP
jgi:hypothetical protein